jgi:hypothetical protein
MKEERFKVSCKKVKLAFEILEYDDVKPSFYVKALYQWSNDIGMEYIDQYKHLIKSDVPDANDDAHKKERAENWQKYLALLSMAVAPQGAFLIAYVDLQTKKEGSTGLASYITECKDLVKLLTYCPECADKCLAFQLAAGMRKDARTFQRCLKLKPTDKSPKWIEIIGEDRTTQHYRGCAKSRPAGFARSGMKIARFVQENIKAFLVVCCHLKY